MTLSDPLHVLIVDDDNLLAELIARELQLGCIARCVSSGPAALQMLDENFDLLLIDWHMPGLDGLELIRRARDHRGKEKHLYIALMAAPEDIAARSAALSAGVDDFLSKPIDRFQLELALATARRNRMLQRRLTRRNQLLSRAHSRTREALEAVRTDLKAAAALHERLLPRPEQFPNLRAAHLYRPATVLGGDTMGANAVGDGLTLFFLIDVRGHGVPAALESFHLHHRLKGSRPDNPASLVEATKRLNREMMERGDESYATMLVGIIDAQRHCGWIVCAGHPNPLLMVNGKQIELPVVSGFPLGWFADADFAPIAFDFPPGARLAVYSDGLIECHSKDGGEVGVEGLQALLVSCADKSLVDLIKCTEDSLDLRDPLDDVSLLALECPYVGEYEE